MRRQRSFFPLLPTYVPSYAYLEELLQEMARKCPGCTEWPADEALLVGALIHGLETQPAADTAWLIRHCGLPVPPTLRHDRYSLIKYFYSHWHDPVIRNRILTKATIIRGVERLKRELVDLTPAKANQLVRKLVPMNMFAVMHQFGLKEQAEALLSMLDEEGLAYYRGDVLRGQMVCYKLWRETEPQALPLRKRRELMQRIQRRNVTLRHLQHSLYQLNQNRKALVRMSWEAERGASQALDELIRRQEELQSKLEAVKKAHSNHLVYLRSTHAEALSGLRSYLEEHRRTLAEALAERRCWSQAQPLTGQTVVVIGDLGHAEAYQDVITALGGRPVVVDGLDRFGRIREVAPEADAVILITAAIKHSAGALLTATVPVGVPVLYCPRAGRASLDRVIRSELLPLLIARQAAISDQGGAPDAR